MGTLVLAFDRFSEKNGLPCLNDEGQLEKKDDHVGVGVQLLTLL
jgi:hypothetical protein